MAELWFIRHGETEYNARGLMQGHLDIPLSEIGWEQAHRLAMRVERGEHHFTGIFASDLRRAWDTAEAVGRIVAQRVVTDPLLREIDVGALSGLTRERVRQGFPDYVDRIRRDVWNTPRPEGESAADVATRFLRFLERLDVRAERYLIVTHGGTIRAALKVLLELDGHVWRRFHIGNTSITRIGWPEGQAHCVGDAAHLERWPRLRYPEDADDERVSTGV